MRQIYQILKQLWRFLADAGGVIATLTIFIKLLNPLIQSIELLYKQNPIYGITFGFILIISLLFLFRVFSNKIFEFFEVRDKEKADSDLKVVELEPSNINLRNIILSNSKIDNIKILAEKKAKRWASDAVISRYNYYIVFSEGKIIQTFQISHFSKWKNETFTHYYPNLSDDLEEANSWDKNNITLFYKISRWKNNVLKAYEKISSGLPSDFKLTIHSQKDDMSINFVFIAGKIKKTISFKYDGRNLISN